MDQLRSYVCKTGGDIWSLIHQAIQLAAVDYPDEFSTRRGEIAETLFSRSLLEMRSTRVSAKSDILEEGEVGNCETERRHVGELADDRVQSDEQRHDHGYHDDAETLTAEIQEETRLLREIDSIKETIQQGDQTEKAILETLQRLQYMHITVEALKTTEIGKHVRSLQKHSSKKVRGIAKELVRHWKILVDEWVNSTRGAVEVDASTEYGECPKTSDRGHPSSITLDHTGAPMEARTSSVNLSQLFNFIDGRICGQSNHSALSTIEHSVKENLNEYSRSQTGSVQTDSSDLDAKAITSRKWVGFRTPEERGSATRDPPASSNLLAEKAQTNQLERKKWSNNGGGDDWQSTQKIASGSESEKPTNETLKSKGATVAIPTTKFVNSSAKKTATAQANNTVVRASLVKPETQQVDQKLEIAKRKLHQGYQQAENAKKQRVVQVLDIPDLPKTTQGAPARSNPHVQKHGSQNRRYN